MKAGIAPAFGEVIRWPVRFASQYSSVADATTAEYRR